MDTTLALAHAYEPSLGGYVVRALLTVRGAAPAAAARPPIALSLVLDRSGSMSGPPLEAARDAAVRLVRRLAPHDVVSVVAYDDTVTTEALPGTGAAHQEAVRAIAALVPGGSTNLSGGWLRGRELVAESLPRDLAPGAAPADGLVRRVVLLTDGHANAGITDPTMLCGLTRAARAQGITTTTIGFGDGYDETLLRAMADAGGGNTYYVEHVDQASAVFAEEVEGLLALAAQNVAVEVRPGAAVRLVAVHHDYPQLALADGVRVELGDLYAHEPRALLLEFLVAGAPDVVEACGVAELRVQGHVLGADGSVARHTVTLTVASPLAPEGADAPEVTTELLLLAAARAREAAARARETGDYAAGAAALRASADALLACPPAAGEGAPALADEAADLAAMAERFANEEATGADAKYLRQMAYASHRRKAGTVRTLRRER